jgi:tRNA threonylcarbamoyladenosine biosynthesis protein TsaE
VSSSRPTTPASSAGAWRRFYAHVDAYRLGDAVELDDLDIDTALDESVTVVEWGVGIAEGLSDQRLEVRLGRAAEADGEIDPRTVTVRPHGARWFGVPLRTTLVP